MGKKKKQAEKLARFPYMAIARAVTAMHPRRLRAVAQPLDPETLSPAEHWRYRCAVAEINRREPNPTERQAT